MKKCNILLILLVLPFLANGFNGKAKVGGLWYNIVTKAEKAEVTNPDVGAYSGAIRIPSTIVYEGVSCNVTAIDDGAFAWGTITSIDIPNSVTKIANAAFRFCYELKSINMSNSVTDIESMAFGSCGDLTNVKLSDNIKYIPNGLFEGCYQLKSIVIPAGVTKIGMHSFNGCKGLTSITFNNALDSICDAAFQDCGIKSISIPNSVSFIDIGAFKECKSLISVTLGNGIKKINSNAFANCGDLKDFYFNGDVLPSADENVFNGSDVEYSTLHVAESLIDVCKNTEPWKEFGKIVANPNVIVTPSTAFCQEGTVYEWNDCDTGCRPEPFLVRYKFENWLEENVKFPDEAKSNGISYGVVTVDFIVEPDGSISNVEASSGNSELRPEAERVIKTMPKWRAGKVKGKYARVKQQQRVRFELPQ